jgi:predicted nuclease with TOPRIM domain
MLLYRGVLPFIPPADAATFYERIVLPIRERLNLPDHDPLKEFLDNRSVDAENALREAQTLFESKRREVRELREALERNRKELARRENAPAPKSTAPQSSNDTDPELRKLRDKMKNLESDLKQRHNERNELERRLERMQTRVDSLVELSCYSLKRKPITPFVVLNFHATSPSG